MRAGRRARLGAWGLVVAPLVLAACGKRGDPLPPLRRNPEPIPSLEVVQRADRVELSWVNPTRTLDGARLGVLDVEVWRAVEPGPILRVGTRTATRGAPGERLVHREPLPEPGVALRFAVRTASDGRESAFSPEVALAVSEPPPPPSDMAAALTPDGIALSWTECVATTPEPALPAAEAPEAAPTGEPTAPPPVASEVPSAPAPPPVPAAASPPPAAPAAPAPPAPPGAPPPPAAGAPDAPGEPPGSAPPATAPPAAAAPAGPAPAPGAAPEAASPPPVAPPPSLGVRLYRRTEEGAAYEEPLVPTPLATQAWQDQSVRHGQRYCYVARTVLSGQPSVEGGDSAEVCVTFLDRTPPPAPRGLALLRREEGVELSWSRPEEGSEPVSAYRVARSTAEGPPERLAELSADATRFTDTQAPAGEALEYTVTATDAAGNESAPARARLAPR